MEDEGGLGRVEDVQEEKKGSRNLVGQRKGRKKSEPPG